MKPRMWIPNPEQEAASHYLRSTFVAELAGGQWQQLYEMVAILYDLEDPETSPSAFRQLLNEHRDPAGRLRALERWADQVGQARDAGGPIQVVMPDALRLNKWLRTRVRTFSEFASILTEDTATFLALARGADIARSVSAHRERQQHALPLPLLLQGPTGAGKELLARGLHQISQRTRSEKETNGFGPVNCGGLPTELIESELFGHKKGSFTGASENRRGVIETHASGTVFLDEIGDTPAAVQVRLLRFLNDGEVRRVGEDKPRQVSPWVIGATHRDLLLRVREGHFREDLMFRLLGNVVTLPALAAKRSDILPVLTKCIEQRAGRPVRPRFVEPAKVALETYGWPGNLRELSQFAGSLVGTLPETASELVVELGMLPTPIQQHYLSSRSISDQIADLYRHRVSQRDVEVDSTSELREALVNSYVSGLRAAQHSDLRFALVIERLVGSKLFEALAGPEVALKAHAVAAHRREMTVLRLSEQLREKLADIDGVPISSTAHLVRPSPREDELPSWVRHLLRLGEEASVANSPVGATLRELLAMLEWLSPTARSMLEELFTTAIREVQAEGSVQEVKSSQAPDPQSPPSHAWAAVRESKPLFERYLGVYETAVAMARAFDVSDRTIRNAARALGIRMQRGGARVRKPSGPKRKPTGTRSAPRGGRSPGSH